MKAIAKALMLLGTTALLAVACGKKQEAPAPAPAAEAADLGKEVYMGKGACFSCHGDQGLGNGPAGAALKPAPRNFTDAKWRYGTDLASVKNVIAKGSKGTSMVGYEATLSAEEIEAVAKYVLKLGGKAVQ